MNKLTRTTLLMLTLAVASGPAFAQDTTTDTATPVTTENTTTSTTTDRGFDYGWLGLLGLAGLAGLNRKQDPVVINDPNRRV